MVTITMQIILVMISIVFHGEAVKQPHRRLLSSYRTESFIATLKMWDTQSTDTQERVNCKLTPTTSGVQLQFNGQTIDINENTAAHYLDTSESVVLHFTLCNKVLKLSNFQGISAAHFYFKVMIKNAELATVNGEKSYIVLNYEPAMITVYSRESESQSCEIPLKGTHIVVDRYHRDWRKNGQIQEIKIQMPEQQYTLYYSITDLCSNPEEREVFLKRLEHVQYRGLEEPAVGVSVSDLIKFDAQATVGSSPSPDSVNHHPASKVQVTIDNSKKPVVMTISYEQQGGLTGLVSQRQQPDDFVILKATAVGPSSLAVNARSKGQPHSAWMFLNEISGASMDTQQIAESITYKLSGFNPLFADIADVNGQRAYLVMDVRKKSTLLCFPYPVPADSDEPLFSLELKGATIKASAGEVAISTVPRRDFVDGGQHVQITNFDMSTSRKEQIVNTLKYLSMEQYSASDGFGELEFPARLDDGTELMHFSAVEYEVGYDYYKIGETGFVNFDRAGSIRANAPVIKTPDGKIQIVAHSPEETHVLHRGLV